MSEPHEFGPVEVDGPMRPMDWDAYQWCAYARCSRCRQMISAEYLIPGPVVHLIPSDERDKAMRIMGEFVRRRVECFVQMAVEYQARPCRERT